MELPGPGKLVAELRRRRVLNTVVVYIVGAWVVLQAADLAFPGFGIPESALAWVWLGAFLLFPLVLVFGWKYDLHATGIERTPPAEAGEEFDTALQPPDRWLIGTMGTVAVTVITVLLAVIARVEPSGPDEVTPNSIAVMPFEWCPDRIGDMALAGGIHAAVIDRLAARERLKVIGRNSVYTMASTQLLPQRVAELFRVQYLLQGELCRDGVDLVLRAELINRGAAIAWNATFRQVVVRGDQVEQQLASLVASGIALELGEIGALDSAVPVNTHALEMLRIAQHHHLKYHEPKGAFEEAEKAQAYLEKALEYQPEFAEAIFEMASVKIDLVKQSTDSVVERYETAGQIAEDALLLARKDITRGSIDYKPYALAAHILEVLSYWQMELTWRESAELAQVEIAAQKKAETDMLQEAEEFLHEAIRLNPSNAELRIELISVLERLGPERRGETLDILEQARSTEPFDENIARKLANNLALRGQYQRAMEELERFAALGDISNEMRWWQLEIQQDYGVVDDRLAVLMKMLQNEPEKFERVSAGLSHLFWVSSQMPLLGLLEEAESLHNKLLAIPERADATEWEQWAYQFFLLDRYRINSGQQGGVDEVFREKLAEVDGLSNQEILDRWYLEAWGIAGAFWSVGERDRSIELFEALQHFRISPRWAQRAPQLRIELALRYLAEGREAEAVPVLEELADLLEAELAAGVRHPMTLFLLAQTYAWQNHYDEALEMLTMAVDYGFYGDAMSLPDSASNDELEEAWSMPWRELEHDPRRQQQLDRQEAIVERQAANIQTLLASYDIDQLLAPVIEVHAASYQTN
jgi:TolB-like protein/Tfp pilus assembly protein PilF